MTKLAYSLYSAVAVIALGLAGSANAQTAVTASTDVNMRADPSTSSPVVSVLKRGQAATLFHCGGNYGWCAVESAGQQGWVAGRFLYINGQPVTAVGAQAGVPIVKDTAPAAAGTPATGAPAATTPPATTTAPTATPNAAGQVDPAKPLEDQSSIQGNVPAPQEPAQFEKEAQTGVVSPAQEGVTKPLDPTADGTFNDGSVSGTQSDATVNKIVEEGDTEPLDGAIGKEMDALRNNEAAPTQTPKPSGDQSSLAVDGIVLAQSRSVGTTGSIGATGSSSQTFNQPIGNSQPGTPVQMAPAPKVTGLPKVEAPKPGSIPYGNRYDPRAPNAARSGAGNIK